MLDFSLTWKDGRIEAVKHKKMMLRMWLYRNEDILLKGLALLDSGGERERERKKLQYSDLPFHLGNSPKQGRI